jgi:hypothetical protein
MTTVTLDAIVRQPAAAAHLPPEARAGLLAQALAVVGALATPAIATNGSTSGHEAAEGEDRLLNAEQAAALLSVTTRWLRRHGPKLPFRRELSPKTIRYSEAGLRRWQARQRA